MNILFWNVDTQKDFMNSNGALYIKGAEDITLNLKALTDFAAESGIKVVSTKDFHTVNSKEISDKPDFKVTFPKHCIAGTEGEEFIKETSPELIDKSYCIINYTQKEIGHQFDRARNIIIYKDDFDVFKGNKLSEEILKRLQPDLVVVYGVATNVCVDFAVRGISSRLCNVAVVTDAIKELPNSDVKSILQDWEDFGVILISTKSLFNLIDGFDIS